MSLAPARLVLFLAGAIAAGVLQAARIHPYHGGMLAYGVVLATLLAIAWPRALATPLACASFTIGGLYVLAGLARLAERLDPEDVDVASTAVYQFGAAAACGVVCLAALVANLSSRRDRRTGLAD